MTSSELSQWAPLQGKVTMAPDATVAASEKQKEEGGQVDRQWQITTMSLDGQGKTSFELKNTLAQI